MRVKMAIAVSVFTLAFALLPAGVAWAEQDPVGTAAMMDVGVGARALGMGGAFIAVADDASAFYYNPGGLAFVEGHQVTSLYTSQYGAVNYMALGYAQKSIGAGALLLDASSIESTDEFANIIGYFGMRECTVIAAYGAEVLPGLGVGGSVKYYSQALPDNAGSGFTGDMGLVYDIGMARVGAVARNLVGGVRYTSGSEDAFDRSWGVGVSAKPIDGLLLAADAIVKGDYELRAGAEYVIGHVAVRGGCAWGAGHTSLTAGLGVRFGGFSADYAYQAHSVLPDSHRLSLSIAF